VKKKKSVLSPRDRIFRGGGEWLGGFFRKKEGRGSSWGEGVSYAEGGTILTPKEKKGRPHWRKEKEAPSTARKEKRGSILVPLEKGETIVWERRVCRAGEGLFLSRRQKEGSASNRRKTAKKKREKKKFFYVKKRKDVL